MTYYGEGFRYGWSSMKSLRREFRRNPTEAEKTLWKYLRAKKFHGLQFRRQHGIGRFVVDFCHTKSRTIVEVDGGIHDDPKVRENDLVREKELEELGYRILRFKNHQVLNDIDSVLECIIHSLQNN